MSDDSIAEIQYALSPWHMTAIIFDFNTEEWEMTAWSEDLTHAVMKRATTIEGAFKLVQLAIEAGDYWAPRAERSRLATAASDILSLMGIGKAKPQEPVKRRVIP
jgi:hypothetical protein